VLSMNTVGFVSRPLLVGLDGRQGENSSMAFGGRHIHPADRAAGYYGFWLT
jgi:hypothetical protein